MLENLIDGTLDDLIEGGIDDLIDGKSDGELEIEEGTSDGIEVGKCIGDSLLRNNNVFLTEINIAVSTQLLGFIAAATAFLPSEFSIKVSNSAFRLVKCAIVSFTLLEGSVFH